MMLKNPKLFHLLNREITKVSSGLNSFALNHHQSFLPTVRNYCYKARKNPFQQWDDFIEPSDAKIVEKFESNKKTSALLKKQEEQMLSNLGLEKYVELFEANLKAMKGEKDESKQDFKIFEQFLDTRKFKEHSVEQFSRLIDSEETRQRIEEILKNYELEKYNTSQVPSALDEEMMEDCLQIEKTSDLIKNFNHLFKREVRKYTRKKSQEVERIETEERLARKFSHSKNRTGLEFTKDGSPIYAKWKNTMFISLNNFNLRKENERRQRDAILFGPKLVLDFGYSHDLYKRQSFSTIINQLFFTINEIIEAKTPFHLTFCNLGQDHPMKNHLDKKFPYLNQPNCLYDITSKSYLDIFPKEKLVYLTPDAPKSLETVDQNKIYIVGAFSDKFCCSDYSFQKAKSEDLPAYKLPLEDYFFFKHDRVLTINLVVGILENYMECQDWKTSFIGKVPPRKLKTPEELRLEQIRKVRKFYSKEKFFKIYKMNESQDANTPSFQPNIFKSNGQQKLGPRSPRFYNPSYTPDFRIKYTPAGQNSGAKHKTNQDSYRQNLDYNSKDPKN